ncbi:glycoside hydrolase family protein [Flavobacterium aurantiibacter]|uniref:Uncharacterized protein n=1 Tax=Flavobacterium aurantiibacter TaxID=2023067 RepID=A0A255ZP08_9FLAO|nr:hypothetical protein [Flavobacterium aurantiibacter]OYQ43317.1 hypothetical protein CHX27_10485 [Flavobacterium aurantiibacter]
MKKKVEGELISIAHRVLKLKDSSDLRVLHEEAKNLYEKLSVLLFVETQFGSVMPTIGKAEIQDLVVEHYEKPAATVLDTAVAEEKETPISEIEVAEVPEVSAVEEETTEVVVDENPEPEPTPEPLAVPAFETRSEAPKQISFADLLGSDYTEPIFDKVSDAVPVVNETQNEEPASAEVADDSEEEIILETRLEAENVVESIETPFDLPIEEVKAPAVDLSFEPTFTAATQVEETKSVSFETQPENGLRSFQFGLNDRIGFERNLFGGSAEDMNRVVSQLSTFNSYEEAAEFIDEMVRPDYNNWNGKDEYVERFLDIIKRRFS